MAETQPKTYKLYTDFFTDGPLPEFNPDDLPRFKPNKTRKQNLKNQFNCYAFAVDNIEHGMLIPGTISEMRSDMSSAGKSILRTDWDSIKHRLSDGADGPLPDVEEIVQSAIAGALNDGCIRLRRGDNVPEGYYPAALVGFETFYEEGQIAPLAPDFHLLAMYRDVGDDWQKDKGYVGWAQKLGKNDIARRDAANQLITDPREAEYKRPGRFYTFLAVPKGGVQLNP